MKGFHKLALAAAIAAVPAAGLAMQPLEDAELSGVVGQDGISLDITTNVDVDLGWEDTSGVDDGVSLAVERGMVYMPNFNINGNIGIDIDAGSTAGTVDGGVLQIAVSLPDITISNFEIYVSGSGNTGADYVGTDGLTRFDAVKNRVDTDTPAIAPVLSLGAVTLEEMDLTIQLGEDATNFAEINTAAPVTIELTNLAIVDSANGGSLHVGELALEVDPDGTTIGVDDDFNGEGPALVITMPQSDQQIAMMQVGLGDGATQQNTMGNFYTNVRPQVDSTVVVRGR